MIEIKQILPGSIADELGIKAGDQVISVNDKEINDALDYRFHITADMVELLIKRDNEELLFDIEKDHDNDLGLELTDLEMRSCGNSCIFCFVYQNPKGLRKPLYFKDEDYRFSFLYGHYTTLTNATQEDLHRIVDQRLTPLYISVHVTEPNLRKLMLGIKTDDRLFEKINYLTENGIELNCQVVLCPGLNDGKYLEKTIEDLKPYYPMIRSIAIVPVGLTEHRKNLYEIKPVTHEYSLKTIIETDQKRYLLKKELNSSFVYLSDEFYIRTNTPIPENEYYESFYQLENGVGLTRDFITRFQEEFSSIQNFFKRQIKLDLVTGVLGSKVLNRYFKNQLYRLSNLQINIHTILNDFYGHSIVVSGLLVGQDIFNNLKDKELGDFVVLPPDCLNNDGLFLDDWTLQELENKLGKKIFVFQDTFLNLFQRIKEYEAALSYNCR